MGSNWIEEYWGFMMQEDFEKAIPLKLENFPKSFFKYRALSNLTLESLSQGYIWLSEIISLNDPFECSIQFDNDECWRHYYSSPTFQETFKTLTGSDLNKIDIDTLVKSAKPYEAYLHMCHVKGIPFNMSADEQLKRVQNRWVEIVEEMNRNLRICSFSTNNRSLLLWSHYSNEHKGICVEYDFIEADRIRTFIQPMMYRNEIYKLGLFDDYTFTRMIGSSLIKSKDWEYEQEWRVTIFKQADEFPQKLRAPTPKAIYIGTRFDLNAESLKREFWGVVQAKNIPVYKMTKHHQEFSLISTLL